VTPELVPPVLSAPDTIVITSDPDIADTEVDELCVEGSPVDEDGDPCEVGI